MIPNESIEGRYMTERITNIGELEKLIERAHLSVLGLIQGIESGEILTVLGMKKHLGNVSEVLQQAYTFEFCIERRIADIHIASNEGGKAF